MRLDKATVAHFKSMAKEIGIPNQSLINLYLRYITTSSKWSELPNKTE